MKWCRFHFIYILKYTRYAVILSVIPLLRALLRFDLPSLFAALQQDGLIFVGTALFALAQWTASGIRVQDGQLQIRRGAVLRLRVRAELSGIGAVQLHRPLYCRMVGATELTIWDRYSRRKYRVYLWAGQAAALADQVLPVYPGRAVFSPAGAERLQFAVLSANLITTGVVSALAAQRTADLLGEEWNRFAIGRLEWVEQMVERVLPTGTAWLVTLGLALASIAVLRSFLHTAKVQVCRSGGVILSRGGVVNKTERRVLAAAVTSCEIRVTPLARLLGRSAVYIQAGGFHGDDLPLLVYKGGDDGALRRLLPEFYLSRSRLVKAPGRSLAQFLWRPGALVLLCGALCGVAVWALPEMVPLLVIPLLLSLVGLAVSAEAFFTETLARTPGRSLEIRFGRFLTQHRVCVFSPDAAFVFRQHPLLYSRQICNVTVKLPGGKWYQARGIPEWETDNLPLLMSLSNDDLP